MVKTAYLHTFHSQVASTLLKIDLWPDTLLSFDSHADTQMGVKEHLDAFPPEIRDIALRASAHTYIRDSMGFLPLLSSMKEVEEDYDNPPMYLIIPEKTFNVGYKRFTAMTAHQFEEKGSRPITQKRYISFTQRNFAINLFMSPPKNLGKFVEKIDPLEDSVWDIDVDYFAEMQRECYSPFEMINPRFLGKMSRVLKLIRIYLPDVLTISEMKKDALTRTNSQFSRFISEIKRLGYVIDSSNILDQSDDELITILKKYEKYVKEIQEPIIEKHSSYVTLEASTELIEAIEKFWK